MNNRKLILYISMSVDGYLATEDDGLDWLSLVDREGEDYSYFSFVESVDTYIVGRKTYEVVMKLTNGVFAQADQFKCFVITSQKREDENGVTFYNGDLEELILKLKKENGKNIYCDGGAQVVKTLMDKNLIDEYIISVIPTLLGSGKRLFVGGTPPINLKPLPSKYYESGLVQLHYEKA